MSVIIAARFKTFEQAQKAASALISNGVNSDDLHTFYVNPSGEHAQLPIGGDQLSDPASTGAMHGAFGGAAILGVAGAAIGSLIGFSLGNSLIPIVIGAGLGAYVGSLVGTVSMLGRKKPVDLSRTPKADVTPNTRPSGVLLAVRADTLHLKSLSDMLREHGGIEVERAQGHWQAGQWQDFDPLEEQNIQKPIIPELTTQSTPEKL